MIILQLTRYLIVLILTNKYIHLIVINNDNSGLAVVTYLNYLIKF